VWPAFVNASRAAIAFENVRANFCMLWKSAKWTPAPELFTELSMNCRGIAALYTMSKFATLP
jgi:hypothetical protein